MVSHWFEGCQKRAFAVGACGCGVGGVSTRGVAAAGRKEISPLRTHGEAVHSPVEMTGSLRRKVYQPRVPGAPLKGPVRSLVIQPP